MFFSKEMFFKRSLIAIALLFGSGNIFGQSAGDVQGGPTGSAADKQPISAQDKTYEFTNFVKYDNGAGYRPSVAFHSSGLAIEVHVNGNTQYSYDGVFYRIGKFENRANGVTWGPSIKFIDKSVVALAPSVAITKEGYVIISFEEGYKLKYSVAQVDPFGSVNQTMAFRVWNEYYDKGEYPSIAVNSLGVIAEVHMGDNNNGNLYSRRGHLRSPESGNFDIVWDSGTNGKKYDRGRYPHVAINVHDEVVEVHEGVSSNNIWYT